MKMKALHLVAPDTLELVEKDIPKPGKGQILIKMAYSPINPSDLAFLTGKYGIQKPLPTVPGFEGSGTVIESGGGLYAGFLKGKNVACVASEKLDGPWAEYMITDAGRCVILNETIPLEQAAMSFVNPLTALDFIDMAQKGGYDGIVMTAAASSLAKMVHYQCKQAGVSFAGIVRKAEQMQKLQIWGADLVVNSENEGWETELKQWASKQKKVLFPDAIGGGELPFNVLNCLPEKSKLLIYGSLDAAQPATYIPRMFIYKQYEVAGYWLSKKSKGRGLLQSLLLSRRVQRMLKSGFENDIQAKLPLGKFEPAIELYSSGMSKGKVLFDLN
jgi:NADPH2:quinone reductase